MISELKFTFTPTAVGTQSTQLTGYDTDEFINHDGNNVGKTFTLTGVGIQAPVKAE